MGPAQALAAPLWHPPRLAISVVFCCMKKIEWLTERELMLDGVRFRCELEDFSQKTNAERIFILKNRGALETYATCSQMRHHRTCSSSEYSKAALRPYSHCGYSQTQCHPFGKATADD
jgi:hypothetical protein